MRGGIHLGKGHWHVLGRVSAEQSRSLRPISSSSSVFSVQRPRGRLGPNGAQDVLS